MWRLAILPVKIEKHIIWLGLIIALSLIWKVALLYIALKTANSEVFTTHDTQSYVSSAWALIQTGSYSVAPDQLEPQTIRTPGYPIFLALIFGAAGENFLVVLIIQIFFSLGTIGMVYWIGSKLWNNLTGMLAALLLALDMNSIGLTLVVLTETLFTFFLVAFIASVVVLTDPRSSSLIDRTRRALFFLSGTLLAITTHIRPISYYFIIIMIIFWAIWGLADKLDRNKNLMDLLVFSVPLIMLIGGWQVRNYLQTGSSQFCAIENLSIIHYRAAMVIAERDGISREAAINQIVEQYGLDREVGWDDEWRAAGLMTISENPRLFLKQYFTGMMYIFVGPGSERPASLTGIPFESSSPFGDLFRLSLKEYYSQWILPHPTYFGAFIFSILHMLIIYAGVAYLVIQRLVKHRYVVEEIFLVSVLLYFVMVSAGPEANSRFRVPITPVLALLSASAIQFFPVDKPKD